MKKSAAITANVIAIASCAFITTAHADNDKGAYLGLGAGFYNTDLKLKSGGSSITFGDTQHDAGVNLFVGYNFDLGTWRLGTELSYTNSYGNIEDWTAGTATLTGKLENSPAVSILPAIKLNKETSAFFRLGYGNVKGVVSGSGTINGTSVSQTESEKFNAALWGLGMEYAASDRAVLRIEYQLLDVKGKTFSNIEYTPRATGINASLRFSF